MLDSYSGKRAVVIGAGISGLAAARALAEHFEHVVVLERDELPADATARPGVPQGRHPHGLLSGGLDALCNLFPGFSTTLADAGAHVGDFGLHVQCEFPGQAPLPRRALDVPVYIMTRPALELAIRRRVMQRKNVSFRGGCRVVGLVSASDGRSVAGVSCEMRGARPETVLADLVVDASGRAAPTLDFLKSTGRPAPEETTIGVDLGYSSAVYSIAEEALPDFMAVMTMPAAPERSRAAVMLAREDGHWAVALAGRGDDLPPADGDGFLAFAAGLETPTIHDAIKGAKRHGEVVQFAFPESRRRHFNRIADFPRGLIPIGDSVCRFNPIYGQGMSIAAQEAVLLRDLLAAHVGEADPFATLGAKFLSGIEPLIESPWELSALPDLAYPDARGERPAELGRALEYQVALSRAACRDPDINKLMIEVLNLTKPASALNAPDIVQVVTG